MKMVLRPILVIVVVLLSLAAAQQPWVPVGPDGGDVRTLTQDPHAPNHLLLSTSAGMLFESRDGGKNWARLARLGDRNDYVVDAVIFHPTREHVLFAGAWSVSDNYSGDVLRSLDGGRTWKQLKSMHGESVRALAMAPSDPDVLVAGTLSGVYRTTNGGDRWSLISPPDHPDIRNVESIAIDPRDPDVIYAGTWHLPWKTEDGGITWKNIKTGVIDDSDIFSIVIDARSPSIVYMSACSGIYKSEDAGASFRKVQGIPYSSRRTRVLMQDPSRPEVVYAGTTEGLWRTQDAGQTWNRITAGNVIINDVLVDPTGPGKLMLATDRAGVLTSTDSGNHFFASNRGFTHRQISSVLVDANDDGTFYAGVLNDKEFGGVFVSRDGGAAWQQMSAGLEGADVYVLRQDGEGTLLAGTNRGLFQYSQATYRWVPFATSNAIANVRVNALDLSSGRWLAGGLNGLYASDDRGRMWTRVPTEGLTDFVALRRLGEEVIAVSRGGLLISHDGGLRWTKPVLPRVSLLTEAALDHFGNMFVAAREGLFRSVDRGVTWARIEGIPIVYLTGLVWDERSQRLLVSSSSSNQVYESRDAGEHWRALPVGWKATSVNVAGERALAVTLFDGVVLQLQSPNAQRASSGGLTAGAQD